MKCFALVVELARNAKPSRCMVKTKAICQADGSDPTTRFHVQRTEARSTVRDLFGVANTKEYECCEACRIEVLL